jgi:Rap1a immunity proteins
MKMILPLATALMLLSSSAGAENVYSGGHMLPHCKAFVSASSHPSFWEGMCIGQIVALDTVKAVMPAPVRSCSPPAATIMQKTQVIVQFLEANPARLHESFNILALLAMRAAWPCSEKP